MKSIRHISLIAMFLALAVVLSYVEGFLPSPVPGVKLGLAQIVMLLLIYDFSWHEALLVDLGRIFLVSLLRGDIFTLSFFMSLAGGMLSFVVMLFARHALRRLTVYGVSLLGAYAHSFGQVAVLAAIMGNGDAFYYFPFIALLSVLTGLFTAFVAERLLASKVLDRAKKAYG